MKFLLSLAISFSISILLSFLICIGVVSHSWAELITSDSIISSGGKITGERIFSENLAINNQKEQFELDAFYDPNMNYSKFSGRVTDRDKTNHILKVYSENGNVKLFKAGDEVFFNIASKQNESQCRGYIRKADGQYFIMYMVSVYSCWDDDLLRIGSALTFESEMLAKRVKDASVQRVILMDRRAAFLNQLNDVNHFLWSFDQQKALIALDFNKKILALERAKERAQESFMEKKRDQIGLQQMLAKKLDEIDRELEEYRIEKKEFYYDRWHLDQKLGLPVDNRPSKEKEISRPLAVNDDT